LGRYDILLGRYGIYLGRNEILLGRNENGAIWHWGVTVGAKRRWGETWVIPLDT